MAHVKICGLTSVDDARMAVEAGADAIGLNFFSGSVRCVGADVARAIVDAIGDRALTVAVVVDMDEAELRTLQERVGFRCVQFHGSEPPDMVSRFLPHAYKALRVRDESVLEEMARFPGEHILLDAYVKGMPGGTGATFDWKLAAQAAKQRKLTLAGGLTPDNVGDAVRAVQPFCVDVASGVERAAGKKDPRLVRHFIEQAKTE